MNKLASDSLRIAWIFFFFTIVIGLIGNATWQLTWWIGLSFACFGCIVGFIEMIKQQIGEMNERNISST